MQLRMRIASLLVGIVSDNSLGLRSLLMLSQTREVMMLIVTFQFVIVRLRMSPDL